MPKDMIEKFLMLVEFRGVFLTPINHRRPVNEARSRHQSLRGDRIPAQALTDCTQARKGPKGRRR